MIENERRKKYVQGFCQQGCVRTGSLKEKQKGKKRGKKDKRKLSWQK